MASLSWTLSGLLLTPALSQDRPRVQTEIKKLSHFEQDKNGVLWFVKGEGDQETKHSAAFDLSATTDGIVITVVSDADRLDKAVGLAIKMRDALRKNEEAPKHIYIVAFKTEQKAVGYRFYTDGIAAGGKKGGNSTYGPKEAKTKLGDVLDWWMEIQNMAKKGEWGTGHKSITPLPIKKR